jgi:hypothetical protein
MVRWTWACASHVGTSHQKTGQRLQDAFRCFVCSVVDKEVFVAIVSDGAGSAEYGGEGASLVCRVVSLAIRRYFKSEQVMPSQAVVECWIDDARDRIYRAAHSRDKDARDFAATLVCVISDGEETLFAHIGDGCAVVRERSTGTWLVGTWPDHGEYASTTTFVTDQPDAKLRVTYLTRAIDVVSVFSDGIERLVLDMVAKTPAERFFAVVAQPVMGGRLLAGKDPLLSSELKEYLGGEQICARTDDDKTLIVAALR